MFVRFRRVAGGRAQHGKRGNLQPKVQCPPRMGTIFTVQPDTISMLYPCSTPNIFKNTTFTQKTKKIVSPNNKKPILKERKKRFVDCRNRKISVEVYTVEVVSG
jgi:hypothetical protein